MGNSILKNAMYIMEGYVIYPRPGHPSPASYLRVLKVVAFRN
jgi:hypothetical protein